MSAGQSARADGADADDEATRRLHARADALNESTELTEMMVLGTERGDLTPEDWDDRTPREKLDSIATRQKFMSEALDRRFEELYGEHEWFVQAEEEYEEWQQRGFQ